MPMNPANLSLPNGTIDSAINGTIQTVQSFPLQAFIDMVWSGTFEILEWLARAIAGMINFVIHLFSPAAGNLPPVFGYVILGIMIVIALFYKWNSIWGFVNNKIIFMVILLSVVFVIGLALSFLGVL